MRERISVAPVKLQIGSVRDLVGLSPHELLRHANVLLYGHPDILEEAEEREIIRRLYIPRNLNKPLAYRSPKSEGWVSSALKPSYICRDCGRPRSYGSSGQCRYCYILAGRLLFYEASEGAAWLEYQAKGVVMPETEWWDDSDIPATPKRLAPVQWGIDRMNWGGSRRA